MAKLPAQKTNQRGITVDKGLRMKGAKEVFAIGDCTATSYAPTAQVTSQQGPYLARVLHQLAKKDGSKKELKTSEGLDVEGDEEKVRVQKEIAIMKTKISKIQPKPFDYSHQGTLAYIGSEKAIADLPFMNGNIASGGVAMYLF